MMLPKITIDSDVKYVNKRSNSRGDYSPKYPEPKTALLSKKKQNKIFHKTMKSSLKNKRRRF